MEKQIAELNGKVQELMDRLNAVSDGLKGLNITVKNLQREFETIKKKMDL